MRIAFVSVMGGSSWGGSEELWYKTAKLALSNGHEILVSVIQWPKEVPQVMELRNLGATIVYRKHPFKNIGEKQSILRRVVNKFIKPVPFFLMELHIIEKHKSDLYVISQGGVHDIFSYKGIPEFICKNNSILITHGSKEYHVPEIGILVDAIKLYPNIKANVFVSQRNLDHVKIQLCNSLENAKVIYNTFKENNLSSQHGLSFEEKQQFALVGRIQCNHKGHHILLQILSKPKWLKRAWHLNIYGEGPDMEFVKDLTDYLQLKDRVTFHGHVSSKEEIWKQNNILVLPSFYEGTPLVLIEAMMHGRTAIVNDVGGNTEVARDGETAFISKAPTLKFFEEAMQQAWNDRSNWNRMGVKARKNIEPLFQPSPEQQLLDLILS